MNRDLLWIWIISWGVIVVVSGRVDFSFSLNILRRYLISEIAAEGNQVTNDYFATVLLDSEWEKIGVSGKEEGTQKEGRESPVSGGQIEDEAL
jgi:hypothetical protein